MVEVTYFPSPSSKHASPSRTMAVSQPWYWYDGSIVDTFYSYVLILFCPLWHQQRFLYTHTETINAISVTVNPVSSAPLCGRGRMGLQKNGPTPVILYLSAPFHPSSAL